MKTDIRQHTDDELSLIVMNDEHLYNIGLRSTRSLIEIVEETFIYTDAQLCVLEADLQDIEE